MLPMMIFSGLYINVDKIPQYFRWLSYISPMRWAYVGYCENEFPGTNYNSSLDRRSLRAHTHALVADE
jgi:DUF1365 family protein